MIYLSYVVTLNKDKIALSSQDTYAMDDYVKNHHSTDEANLAAMGWHVATASYTALKPYHANNPQFRHGMKDQVRLFGICWMPYYFFLYPWSEFAL